jgi:hypothetical protein
MSVDSIGISLLITVVFRFVVTFSYRLRVGEKESDKRRFS